MPISKFDLYKREWIELVFAGRNKAYGAYELRQHNARAITTAMILTFGMVGIFGVGLKVFASNHHTAAPETSTVVTLAPPPENTVKPPPPVINLPKPPAPQVATQRFIPPVVTPDNQVTEEPPKIDGLTEAISTETHTGTHGDPIPVIEDSGPGKPDVTEDNSVHNLAEVQVMPTPMGGEDAWTKFLTKNLHYPPEAQDANVGGRVYMSFVVEKDGSLTDIAVVRGAGYGMDEEATRVLKLAKPWKPGIQNGRPVRVKFVIPINFQMGGD